MKALCLLVLLAPVLPVTADDASSRPASPSLSKKIWTTEDVEALREKGLVSLVGSESPAPSRGEEEPQPPMAGAPPKAQDPAWYLEQSQAYLKVIEVFDAAIRKIELEISDARYWEPGVTLERENLGITPQSQLEILHAWKREALDQLAELRDQARRNHIPPAVVP